MKNGLEGNKNKMLVLLHLFLFYIHTFRIFNPKEIKLLNKQFLHVMKTLVLNHTELLLFKFLHYQIVI